MSFWAPGSYDELCYRHLIKTSVQSYTYLGVTADVKQSLLLSWIILLVIFQHQNHPGPNFDNLFF